MRLRQGAGTWSWHGWAAGDREDFRQAVEFLFTVRCFLHYRHERDDNTLDWQAQDAAAKEMIGPNRERTTREEPTADAAYWMRLYFRHARIVERCLTHMLEAVPAQAASGAMDGDGRRLRWRRCGGGPNLLRSATGWMTDGSFWVRRPLLGAIQRRTRRWCCNCLRPWRGPDARSSAGARSGSRRHCLCCRRIWRRGLRCGGICRRFCWDRYAGNALRAMHALGILELMIPEFHGIDALVIRDAYHRYTVDEHTMVLIDTLHGLETPQTGPMGEWAGALWRDPARCAAPARCCTWAALLHDTGKGRSTDDHAGESARMAESVAGRLELDVYESELLLGLIRNHLEMSAALRRDIFDLETVSAFAGKVQTPEALRMLTSVYLCGHSRGASRRADAVEGGKPVAAVSGHGELPGPQRGRRARGGTRRQGAGEPRGGPAAGQTRARWRRFWRAFRSAICGRARRTRCGCTSRWRNGSREDPVQIEFRYAPETQRDHAGDARTARCCLRTWRERWRRGG